MEIDKILEFFFLRKERYPLNRLNYLENFNQGDRGKLFVDLSSKRIEIDRNTSQLYSRDEYIRRIGREVRKRRFFDGTNVFKFVASMFYCEHSSCKFLATL